MRKICVVVNSRANYARIKTVMREVKARPDLVLQLVVGASALLSRFGAVLEVIETDGFRAAATMHTVIEGDTPATMAKSTGLAIIEFTTILEALKPDIVLTVADRYETMATAISASYMNIPLAHTQGGEVTGSIDESVRHAITKLAHVHFPATERAVNNVIRMGEDPGKVFLTGCPSIDIAAETDTRLPENFFQESYGVGRGIDDRKPYLVVLQHPVTTEYGQAFKQVSETLDAVCASGLQTVWLWPNIDAGSDLISKRLRIFREENPDARMHFYKNLSPEAYLRLVKNCACLIGNSSSALREGAFLGVPAVDIGSRQNARERGPNAVHTPHDAVQIRRAIAAQIEHGPYPSSKLFGDGNAGRRIAQALAEVELSIVKTLHYT